MFDLAPTLESAALHSRDRSGAIAQWAGRAMTHPGGPGAERAMAAAAGQALFSEALLSALKARFNELKVVTR